MRFYVSKYQDDWSGHLPAFDFGHNSSYSEPIKMAPLEAVTGQVPRDPLSQTPTEQNPSTDPQERAQQLVAGARKAQETAKENAAKAQEVQAAQANEKRRPEDFDVGDKVFLKKKGMQTQAPTTRLESQLLGPFKISEKIGNSWKLDMPENYKGSPIFHSDRLRKDHNDPLPQQELVPAPAEEINGEPEWEVDEILESRLRGRAKTLQYRASWKGYDPDDNWYPASDFKNAPALLDDFHKAHPQAAGPPVRLQEWMKAAAADETAEEHDDDDKAQAQGTMRRVRRHV